MRPEWHGRIRWPRFAGEPVTLLACVGLLVHLLTLLQASPGRAQETAAADQADGSGHLIGTVRDDVTGELVPDVLVVLPGLDRETLTDADGRFDFAFVPAGSHRLRIHHIRFGTRDSTVTVVAGETVAAELAFAPRVIGVEPLTISVRRLNPDLLGTGFYRRKLAGRGGFFGEEDYLNAPVRSSLPILEALPQMGPIVVRLGMGRSRTCAPILMDGEPYRGYYVHDYSHQLAGIEVYGPGEAPPTLHRTVSMYRNLSAGRRPTATGGGRVVSQPSIERCGIILLWTDRDGKDFGLDPVNP